MSCEVRQILVFILSAILSLSTEVVYASNYNLIQSDWSGGADTVATAQHPGNQTGWTKYYSKDAYVNTSVSGEVSLSPQPASIIQTGDILDFDRGTLNNMRIVGTGSYVVTRYQETSPSVSRVGAWTSSSSYNPSGGTLIYSNVTGATVTLSFTGIGVNWIGMKYGSFGKANVYLDNVLQGTIDLYNATLLSQQVLYSAAGLTNTAHTLRIEVSGQRHPNSSNTFVGVDAFDVVFPQSDPGAYLTLVDGARSITQTGDILDFDRGTLNNVRIVGTGSYVATRYQETSPSVSRVGAWTSSSSYNPSGGTLIYSNVTGATVTLSFTGISVNWIGMKYGSFGKANVYLDNVLQGTIDLYNATLLSQQVLYSAAGLTNTAHTLRIEVSGQRHPNSSNTFVGVDAFDIVYAQQDTGAYLTLDNTAIHGTYDSPSFDSGSGGAVFSSITWNATVPNGATLKFQMAANNDNQTWNFVGPNGTSSTYYITSGASIYSGHNGNRYFKYRAILDRPTTDPLTNPVLNDVTINYGLMSTLNGSYTSPSFDLGVGGAFFTSLTWNGAVPTGATLKFQMAANNDNQTWNFVGPNGTSSSYYTTSGTPIYSGHNRNRYVMFKAFLGRQTINPADTPRLDDVTINYGVNPSSMRLMSSPYDTTDATNMVKRLRWTEGLPTGTDMIFQMRTGPDGSWGSWYGPHSTTFSASQGVSQITVADVTGFSVGGYVTLTNSADATRMEIKKITAVDVATRRITLDSATFYVYASGSSLTDSYTDPAGTELINPVNRSGNDDRWMQYRVFFFTVNGTATPTLRDITIDYFSAIAVYQPDGLIEGNGNNLYGSFGSGAGGTASKDVDPGFNLPQPLTYDIRVQNDGSAQSIDDTYTLAWNTPSDVSGNWRVFLNNGVSDLSSPVSVSLNVQAERAYTLKVTPSPYAPADSVQDIILNMRSESDYGKADSVKATARVKRIYQADGIIEGNGNNLYDPNRGGAGGIFQKEGVPGDVVLYSIVLQNEGNIADTYTLSLRDAPPSGWKVLLNNGTTDYEITNPSKGFTTPSILPPPYSGSAVTLTLKVIFKGAPVTADMILNIRSNVGARDLDSLTVRGVLRSVYKVDGIIYNYAYDASGNTQGPDVMGTGCGTAGPGDDVYGAAGSGNGGCTAIDISAGVSREISVGVQTEGNIPDRYEISWSRPSGWGIVMQERLNDGSIAEYSNSPVMIPTAAAGNPSSYNSGEVPFFTYRITPPSTFTSGSQTVVFDIRSLGDSTKVDSLKAVINSSDTTPPSSVYLTTDSNTTTSVRVLWTAPGDDGMAGRAASYDLRYSTTPITGDAEFTQASKVRGCNSGESTFGSPRSSGSSESCTISRLFANTDYYFALKTSDELGNISSVSLCPGCPAHTLISSDTTRPGTITDLTVTGVSKDTVTLCWTATADDGTTLISGPLTGYELRYSTRNIVDDGATPGVGQIVFSNAVMAIPVDGWLSPKSQGMRECYIVPVANLIDTGGGIIDDRTRNTRFYFAVKALDEARNRSLLSNVAGSVTPLVPNVYNMVSVPYVPIPNSPQAVFGDDVGAQLYAYWWDSRGPNFDSGCYDGEPSPYSNNPAQYVCSRLTSIREGLGYFLWAPSEDITLDVPSGSTTAPVQNCTDDTGTSFQCYVLPLQEGWNMTGTPFDKEINFTTRTVGGNTQRGLYVRRTTTNNVEVAKFQDAVTARNWIDSSIYTYNGVNYTFEICDRDRTGEPLGTRCSLVMQPWKAYWIRLHVLGNAAFELLIPR